MIFFYFVFDELRDYCIARNILLDCEQEDKTDYTKLFEFLNDLNKNKLSPLEGILKYSYYYLRNESSTPNRLDFCKKILNEYGGAIEYDEFNEHYNNFHNFGIFMIIADSSSLKGFEFEYIIKSMYSINDFWNMLNILVDNEIAGCGLKTEIFLEILLSYPIKSIKKIITGMTDEKLYRFSSEPDRLNIFCLKILEQNEISEIMNLPTASRGVSKIPH